MTPATAANVSESRSRIFLATILAAVIACLGLPVAAHAVTPAYAWTDAFSTPAGTSNTHQASMNGYNSSRNVAATATCQLTNNSYNSSELPCTNGDYWFSGGLSIVTAGAHTMIVKLTPTDGSGQVQTLTRDIFIDWTAPETYYSSGPTSGETITGTTASWEFSASEPSTFECNLDGAGFAACSSGDNFNGLADGSHDFQVRAIDTAGNADPTPLEIVFSVNNAPPAATLQDISSPTTSRQPYWTVNVSRPDASAECRIDAGSWSDCTSGYNAPSELADGEHTVEARAYLSGPTSVQDPPDSQTFVVDATPPEVHFVDPKSAFGGAVATFQFASDSPDIDHFDCLIDPAGTTVNLPGCVSGDSFAPDSSALAGEHVLEIFAIDALGNQSDPILTQWTQYPSPPETTIASRPDPATPAATAQFTFTSPTATEFECSVDGAAFTSCPTTYTVSGLAGGQHALQVRAKDPAGQVDPTPDSAVFNALQVSVPPPAISKISAKGKSISLTASGAGTISVKVETCKKSHGKMKCKKFTTGTATATTAGTLKIKLKKRLKKGKKYRLTITSTSSTGVKQATVRTIKSK